MRKKNKTFISLGALIVCILMFFSTYTLKENEIAIVTQFGKPMRIVKNSGLKFKLPGFFERVIRLDKRSDMLETQPTQLLLGDQKPIIISCYVLWKIADPLLFFQSMGGRENGVQKISDIINSKLSIVLSGYSIENVIITDKKKVLLEEIERKATLAANENIVKKYGIEILKTGVQRLAYPSVVINAVYDRMKSERTKEADKIRAEGNEVARKTTVKADMEARAIRSEAKKQALILKGEGDKESMDIYTEAYREGGEFFTFLQSLETYSSILGSDTTLVISTDSDLLKYLKISSEESDK